jgi:hypothetical protein
MVLDEVSAFSEIICMAETIFSSTFSILDEHQRSGHAQSKIQKGQQ